MAAAQAAVPDRRVEGVHQLPRSVRRVRQRLAARRRRPRAPAGRRTRSSNRPSSSVSRSSPRTRACRRRSGTRRRTRRPATSGPRPEGHPERARSSRTTRASRPTSSRARTTTPTRTSASTGSSPSMRTQRHRPEPERLRRARHHVVVVDGRPRPGRARPRQAAAVRRRATTCCGAPTRSSTARRRIRSRRSARSRSAPEFQERYGYPALTDDDQAQGARPERAAAARRSIPVERSLRVHPRRARDHPPHDPDRLRDVRPAHPRRAPRVHRARTRGRGHLALGCAAAHPRALAAGDELRRHLAARLVDHLVAEHHRALAVALGGRLLVGLEDVERVVELLLRRREHLVDDRAPGRGAAPTCRRSRGCACASQ